MRAFVACALVVAMMGCALLTDLGRLGASDASPTNDSGDDASDAGANLLVNGSFEDGVGGCGPGWTSTGQFQRSSIAHSGASSCEVCITTPGVAVSLQASPAPAPNPPANAQYYGEVWVMVEAPQAIHAALDLEELVSGGYTLGFKYSTPSAAWQRIPITTAPAKAGGTGINYNIGVYALDAGTGCVLVDDAVLVQQ